jgi:hypothetical protein
MNEPEDTGGTVWDAPNQQVVGLDPPWVEGTGGGGEGSPTPHRAEEGDEEPTLDEMTKAQLLVYAGEHGIDVDQSWSKGDIRAAIGEAEEGG